MSKEDDYDRAMTYLLSRMETNGVSAVKVQDGEIFAISRDILENLIEQIDESDKNYAILFIKTGGILPEKGEGN